MNNLRIRTLFSQVDCSQLDEEIEKKISAFDADPSDHVERRAKGPGARLLTASSGRPIRGSCRSVIVYSVKR
uniref:Uncharacterized protein n=1 Tax=Romanomermis culicivorax TaxID=13658 RepID=A0A915JTZ8_ROMCU